MSDVTHSSDSGKGRQFVKFSFFKLDPTFLRLPDAKQRTAKLEFLSAIRSFNRRMLLRSYSLVGLRADTDCMLWQVAPTPEPFRELMTALLNTELGPHLTTPYSYLAQTKRSTYLDKLDPSHDESRTVIRPGKHKYVFVYPFVKKREWYLLSKQARQGIMDEHIEVGTKYQSVRCVTTCTLSPRPTTKKTGNPIPGPVCISM